MPIQKIMIRPHHLLCLQGYKGYNYNQNQVGRWDRVVKMLKKNSKREIYIVDGKDSLCKNCPASSAASGLLACIEKNIQELDAKVKKLLGMKEGVSCRYSDIVELMHKKITQEKHQDLCSRCLWWQKGFCHDSFK